MIWPKIRSLMSGLLRRSRMESDMAEELQAHIELRAGDLMIRGRLTRKEALRRARLEFGAVEKYKEEAREARGLRFFDQLYGDVRYSWRQLRKYPAFTLAATLTIALGISVNAAMFSIVNGWLKPLPVQNPGELVVLAAMEGKNPLPNPLIPFPEYIDYKGASGAFKDLTVWTGLLSGLTVDGRTTRAAGAAVSGNYFSLLGVEPAIGRLIAPVDGDFGGTEPIIALGYSYWVSQLAKDSAVVGKQIKLGGSPYTVIGIVSQEFRGTTSLEELDFYIPLEPAVKDFLTNRDVAPIRIIGRLKPEVTLKQAQASLDVVTNRLQRDHPETNGKRMMRVFPERLSRPDPSAATVVPYVAGVLLLLAGAVLAIACANVLSLFLVRGIGRRGEMAMRTALGASRWQLVRVCLAEAFLIAAIGGITGTAAGSWATGFLETVQPAGMDGLALRMDFGVDWRVIVYAMILVTIATALVGLLPALRSSRGGTYDSLRQSRTINAPAPQTHRLRHFLVAAQVAGSVVFLILAGLLFQHLTHIESLDLGFRRDHLLLVDIDGESSGYSNTQALSVYTAIETRLRSLPGVQGVAQSVVKPFGGMILNANIAAEGSEESSTAERLLAEANFVSAGFFETLVIPSVRGRIFTDADAASVNPMAIVSDIMAARLWPNEEAIGKRFRSGLSPERWIEVVGVVKSIKQSEGFQPLKPPPPQFFMPMGSASSRIRTFYIRTLVPPENLASTAWSEIRSIDPNVAINHVATMEQQVAQSPNGFGIARMFVYIAFGLGLLALLLALVGTYGALSFMVGQQSHEIGIRIALGASRSAVLKIVLQHGLGLALKGIGAGLVLAAVAGRLLQTIMPDVSPFDPVVITSVPLLLLTMAFVTCLVPARKATQIQPILTLKSERSK